MFLLLHTQEHGFISGQRPCYHQKEWHHHPWATRAWSLLWLSASDSIQGYEWFPPCSTTVHQCPVTHSISSGHWQWTDLGHPHTRINQLTWTVKSNTLNLEEMENTKLYCCKRCQLLPHSEVCSGFGFCSSRKYTVIVILEATMNNTFGNKYSVKATAEKMQMRQIIAHILNENHSTFLSYFSCLCFSLLPVI